MKTLVGGAVAAVLGLLGMAIWSEEFFGILAGVVPVTLFLGGALAIYLGFDELKDKWQGEEDFDFGDGASDVDRYKKEIEDLKKEINSLKGSK